MEHYQRLLNVEFDWDLDHLSYQSPVEGLPIPITIDMVKKAISQMKAGKAPGPSGIVVEMIRAAGDMGASMIRDLAVAVIRDGKVPSDWEQSFIVCLYKGKGDALERGNYRGLKLTEQVSVAQLDAPSDWRPGGRGFNPRRGRQHSFMEIDHEIFSTVILSLPLIQEGQLSVSGERMCTILVNRLED